MRTYRLVIRNQDRLLGHFESGGPQAHDAARSIIACLSNCDDYRLELLVADDERRLIESTPQGIRVLSSEPLFRPIPLDT